MKTKPLGETRTTPRGFKYLDFEDHYGNLCSLQESSACLSESSLWLSENLEPGRSAIWLGVDKPTVKVMAKNAAKAGIKTNETTGWIDVPLPKEVSIYSRMHLNREQVKSLIVHLQNWLNKGGF